MPIRPPERLPQELVPFPVEPVYRIRPDLRKLAPGESRFVLDAEWPRYFGRKLELLRSHPEQCRVVAGPDELVVAGLWQVAKLLASQHPGECRVDERDVAFPRLGVAIGRGGELREWGEPVNARIIEHLEPLSKTSRLADALALAVQEDLVLLTGPPGGDAAALLHVCFPSHWNPGEREAASFRRLHQPVPHNERLLAGSRNLVAAMLDKGPFIRHVWSITASADLDQNPARPHQPAGGSGPGGRPLERLFFRAERQTTTPLDGSALFTIRIYVAPLLSVLDQERARVLAQAIRSMDEELLRYKSLTELRGPLLDELDRLVRS